MYGYTPEHAASSQMAFMVYFGSPMVAKFDKDKGCFVKATNDYLWDKFFLVVRSFAFLGLLYSVFLIFPETFPQFGIDYDEVEWYSLGHLFSRKNFKNSFLYTGMSAAFLLVKQIVVANAWIPKSIPVYLFSLSLFLDPARRHITVSCVSIHFGNERRRRQFRYIINHRLRDRTIHVKSNVRVANNGGVLGKAMEQVDPKFAQTRDL